MVSTRRSAKKDAEKDAKSTVKANERASPTTTTRSSSKPKKKFFGKRMNLVKQLTFADYVTLVYLRMSMCLSMYTTYN